MKIFQQIVDAIAFLAFAITISTAWSKTDIAIMFPNLAWVVTICIGGFFGSRMFRDLHK